MERFPLLGCFWRLFQSFDLLLKLRYFRLQCQFEILGPRTFSRYV